MKLLTVREAAATLRLSQQTVYNLCHSGDLVSYRFRGTLRIDESDLESYIRAHRLEKTATNSSLPRRRFRSKHF